MDVLQSQKTLTTLADGHGVIDDVGVIFSTILNHQQPIRKEIKAFVSNYESKKGLGARKELNTATSQCQHMLKKNMVECTNMAQHISAINEQVNSVEALCKSLCKAEEDWATKHADAKAERRPGLVKQIDVSHAWYKTEEVRIDKEAQAQLEGFMKTEAAKYA